MVTAPKFAEDMLPSASQLAAQIAVRAVGIWELGGCGSDDDVGSAGFHLWTETHLAFGYIAFVGAGPEGAVESALQFYLRVLSDIAGIAITRSRQAFAICVHWDEVKASQDLRDTSERTQLPSDAVPDDEDSDD